MLGRDRAAQRLHRVMHQCVDRVFLLVQEAARILALGRLHVVVQVAVAQVAEGDRAHAGPARAQRRIRAGHELGNRRHRQPDVVLDVEPLGRLRRRHRLAQLPHRARLRQRLRHRRVADHARVQRARQQRLEQALRMGLALAVGEFQQHRPGAGRQRLRDLREMPCHQRQRMPADHLEAGQRVARLAPRQAQQRHAGLERVAGRQRGAGGRRLRLQLHDRRGDHAQRALAADVEMAQVIAGVVLAQAGEPVPDLAGRRHHLQPQAELARVAVAQHLGAAGVGRQVAADGAAALRGQAQRQPQSFGLGGLLRGLQHAAGLDRHRQVGRIDRAHPLEPAQAQQQLRAAGVGHRGADQAGVAALRHDRDAVLGAQAHHLRDLLGRAGPGHRQRAARPAPAPVQRPGRQVAFAQHLRRADPGCKLLEKLRGVQAHAAGSAVFSAASRRPAASRARTCQAQAPNSSTDSTISVRASAGPRPRSPSTRTPPSAA